MAINNKDIAELFEGMGTLLEMKGDSVFKVRAYRRAAQTISNLSFPVSQAVAEGVNLREIPGIGKALNDKIHELVQTGSVAAYEKLVAEMVTRNPERIDTSDDSAMGGGQP
jgi:DNA polymerase (family 10)